MKVSIIIKALNEEANIARAIESALRALDGLSGEVILADSISSDRTVEIARQYPIRIVQLIEPNDRCCGIGAQLGFQYAKGQYIYILDGDMEMHAGFLPKAIDAMEQDSLIAGIGGIVVERNLDSLEYQARLARAPSNMQPGQVDRLDMGGLYRREALEQVGYFANRNLHSYEEFDLGVRLRARGFKLWRIAVDAVDHYGHTTPAFTLLKKRWNSGYISGVGEVVRSAIGEPHIGFVLRELKEFWLYCAVIAWWCVVILTLFVPLELSHKIVIAVVFMLFPWAVMVFKKRSIQQANYSLVSWFFHAIGLLRGLFAQQASPNAIIRSVVLHEVST